jgi:hypothetical protein
MEKKLTQDLLISKKGNKKMKNYYSEKFDDLKNFYSKKHGNTDFAALVKEAVKKIEAEEEKAVYVDWENYECAPLIVKKDWLKNEIS